MSKKQKRTAQAVGIDVSQKSLECHFGYLVESKGGMLAGGHRKFPNTASGTRQLSEWIRKKRHADVPVLCVMEATGTYHERCSYSLHDAGMPVSVLPPNRSANYMKCLNSHSKNDVADAVCLADMGLRLDLELWEPTCPEMVQLRQLTRAAEQLGKERTRYSSRIHALKYAIKADPEVLAVYKKLEKLLGRLEEKIKRKALAIVKADPDLKEGMECMASTKGVGEWTASVLIAETGGFQHISSTRQLTGYAGYDVVENQSGKRTGRTKISKKGNPHIRKAMHMPAFSAIANPEFKALYDRMIAKGKTKMQAYTAIQRKLLALCWTLWKNRTHYSEMKVRMRAKAA